MSAGLTHEIKAANDFTYLHESLLESQMCAFMCTFQYVPYRFVCEGGVGSAWITDQRHGTAIVEVSLATHKRDTQQPDKSLFQRKSFYLVAKHYDTFLCVSFVHFMRTEQP